MSINENSTNIDSILETVSAINAAVAKLTESMNGMNERVTKLEAGLKLDISAAKSAVLECVTATTGRLETTVKNECISGFSDMQKSMTDISQRIEQLSEPMLNMTTAKKPKKAASSVDMGQGGQAGEMSVSDLVSAQTKRKAAATTPAKALVEVLKTDNRGRLLTERVMSEFKRSSAYPKYEALKTAAAKENRLAAAVYEILSKEQSEEATLMTQLLSERAEDNVPQQLE